MWEIPSVIFIVGIAMKARYFSSILMTAIVFFGFAGAQTDPNDAWNSSVEKARNFGLAHASPKNVILSFS